MNLDVELASMSSTGVYRTSSRQSLRLQPYSSKASSRRVSPVATPTQQQTSSESNNPEEMRDVLLCLVRKLYPNITPKNDFEILQLSAGIYKTHMGDVNEWLRCRRAYLLSVYGGGDNGRKKLDDYVRTTMTSPLGEMIGLKPRAGATDVIIRQVPGSSYYFRLWPGPASMKHYYLDFLPSADSTISVNSPLDFTLWVATPSSPSPSVAMGLTRIPSLEEKMGTRREDIREGEERYILLEGQQCVFRRSGHPGVTFTIPTRAPLVPPAMGMQTVDFST